MKFLFFYVRRRMGMKKKILSLVLAATMVIGLAGCGGSGDNAAESTGDNGKKNTDGSHGVWLCTVQLDTVR